MPWFKRSTTGRTRNIHTIQTTCKKLVFKLYLMHAYLNIGSSLPTSILRPPDATHVNLGMRLWCQVCTMVGSFSGAGLPRVLLMCKFVPWKSGMARPWFIAHRSLNSCHVLRLSVCVSDLWDDQDKSSLMMTSTSSLDSCWRREATASHKCYISFPSHLFQEVDGKEILLDAEWLEGLYSKLELVEGKELSLPWQGKGGRVTYWRGYSGSSDTQTHTSTSTHDK